MQMSKERELWSLPVVAQSKSSTSGQHLHCKWSLYIITIINKTQLNISKTVG